MGKSIPLICGMAWLAATATPEPRETIEIRILKVKDLPGGHNVFNKPRVYVVVSLWEENEGRPSVCFKTLGQTDVMGTVDPVLDTTFYCNDIPPSLHSKLCIKLRVFNSLMMEDDELLGEVIIDSSTVKSGVKGESTTNHEKDSKDISGNSSTSKAQFTTLPLKRVSRNSWASAAAPKQADTPAQGHIDLFWSVHSDINISLNNAPQSLSSDNVDALSTLDDLTDSQRQWMRDCFDRIDVDGNEKLTVKELKQVLDRLNVKVIDEQAVDKVVSSWFHRFGSAHVGSLNFDEFVAVVLDIQKKAKRKFHEWMADFLYTLLNGRKLDLDNGLVSGVEYQLGEILLSEVSITGSNVSIDPENHTVKISVYGLQAWMRDIGWSFQKLNPSIKDEGVLDLKASDIIVDVKLQFTIDLMTGKPAMTKDIGVNLSIGTFEPRVRANRGSWVYNFVISILSPIIKSQIQGLVKDIVQEEIRGSGIQEKINKIASEIVWRNQPLRRGTASLISFLSPAKANDRSVEESPKSSPPMQTMASVKETAASSPPPLSAALPQTSDTSSTPAAALGASLLPGLGAKATEPETPNTKEQGNIRGSGWLGDVTRPAEVESSPGVGRRSIGDLVSSALGFDSRNDADS